MTKIAAKPVVASKEPLRGVKKRGGRKNRNIEKSIEAIPAIEWEGIELKEFRKSFVDVPAYNTASRKYTEEALIKYHADHEARVVGAPAPGTTAQSKLKPPMVTYPQTPLPAVIQTELKKQGFDRPSPIFSIAWPHIFSGTSVVAVAQSGNEKILAYALPCLVHINDQLVKAKNEEVKPEDYGPIAVVLTNAEKRGEQILEQFKKFGSLLNIKTHFIHGVVEEKEDDPVLLGLNDNPHVVIAVCGPKLNDFIIKKKLNLKRCTFLVFDDASKLAKNARSLENVLGQVRPDRQLIMWNTSFGSNGNAQEAVRQAKKHNFQDYTRLFFGSYGHFYNTQTVKQVVDFFIPEGERDLRFMLTIQTILTASAASAKKPHILVFCNTSAKTRKATDALQRTGLLSKPFQTRNPITAIGETAAVVAAADAKKDDSATPAENAKPEGTETAAGAVPQAVVTIDEQKEINDKEFLDNKLYQIWIANDSIPLDELNFSHFDYIVNYDFPSKNELYEERVVKFQEEAGCGTIYSLLLESSDISTSKYLSNYLIQTNQYCSPRLADERPQPKKPIELATPATPQNAVKKPTVQTKVMGKPTPNRPPSLLQRQNRPFNAGGNRPYPPVGGGNFGGRNNNFNSGGGGRFGGGMGPGPAPRKFNDNFGGNRGGNNFNRNGGAGSGGGVDRANFGNNPGVLDALQLLSQLRNNVSNQGPSNNEPFYSRRSPKRDDFSDRSNDFSGRSNFGGMDNFRNNSNSNSMDTAFGGGRNDFESGNRAGFNNAGPQGRNNFVGGNSGGGSGNGWFKDDTRRFENFSNNWNRNF